MNVECHVPQNEFADAIVNELRSHPIDGFDIKYLPISNRLRDHTEVLLTWTAASGDLIAAPQLKLIQTLSSGYEEVDLQTASDHGIWVSNTPSGESGSADSVAEFAVMLLIAAFRRLRSALGFIDGSSPERPMLNRSLRGKTVCIVGFGQIGSRISALLLPFGAKVVIVNRRTDHAPTGLPVLGFESLKEVFASVDAVVLSVRGSEETLDLISADVLRSAKRGLVLVNVARGSLIDETALLIALQDGTLYSAALDVVKADPADSADRLFSAQNALLLPHIAGFTDRTVVGTVRHVLACLRAFHEQRRWGSIVNEPAIPRLLLSPE